MDSQGMSVGTPTVAAGGVHSEEARLRRQNHLLWAALAIAVIVAVALGGVLLMRPTLIKSDAEATLDSVAAAWTSADPAALAAVHSQDSIFVMQDGTRVEGLTQIQASAHSMAAYDFKIERSGPAVVVGDYVAAPFAWTCGSCVAAGATSGTILGVFQIQNGKVVRHWDY